MESGRRAKGRSTVDAFHTTPVLFFNAGGAAPAAINKTSARHASPTLQSLLLNAHTMPTTTGDRGAAVAALKRGDAAAARSEAAAALAAGVEAAWVRLLFVLVPEERDSEVVPSFGYWCRPTPHLSPGTHSRTTSWPGHPSTWATLLPTSWPT